MKRPFLYFFIFYCLGIIFYHTFKVDISLTSILIIISIFMIVSSFVLRIFNGYLKYQFLIIVFLLGILTMNRNVNKSMLSSFYDEDVQAIAIVKDDLTKEKDSEEKFERYLIYVENIKHLENTYSINEHIILNIYNNTDIEIGDKINIELQIKEPKRNTNPNLFNYKLYLQTKNIFCTSSSKGNNIDIIKKDELSNFEKTSVGFKRKVIEVLDKSLNEKNSSIMQSIILGDSSLLDEVDVLKFRKLGLSHILAISGLHIGIVFGFIICTLNTLKIHRSKSMIISIIIIWIYGYLVGYPASVVRGSTMFSFMILASITNYRYDPLNILSLSGFLMLLYRPMWLFSVGFQLSFLATATILIFAPKIKNVKSALRVIISAQIGTLPIVIYYFNEFQTISILANLILVPLLTISLVSSFIILIASAISIKFSLVIGIFTNVILNISNFISDILNDFTYLNMIIKSPSVLEIIIYYFMIVVLLKIIDINLLEKKVQKFIFTSFMILIPLGIFINEFNSYTKIEFIDVGQGDSCLIRFKNKNILIDTGGSIFDSFNIGDNILLPYLQKTGIKNIDGVFLTHFHEDHAQGVLSLFDDINIKNIFIGYHDTSNNLYNQILKKSNKHSIPIKLVTKGNTIRINKDSYIQILNPPTDVNYLDDNNKSLVFILNIDDKKVLFTGDIESESENYIVDEHNSTNIDIIKVPHHGSKTSSTENLLDHYSPKVSIFQVGRNNNFGHPNEEVVERYINKNSKILRNDELGLITVMIDNDGMSFSSYLKEKDDFFSFVSKNIYSILALILCTISIIILVLGYEEGRKYELQEHIKRY